MNLRIPEFDAFLEQLALNAWAAFISDATKRRLLIDATYASPAFRREAVEAGKKLCAEQEEALLRDWRYDDEQDKYVFADPEDYCRRHCANGVHDEDCALQGAP